MKKPIEGHTHRHGGRFGAEVEQLDRIDVGDGSDTDTVEYNAHKGTRRRH